VRRARRSHGRAGMGTRPRQPCDGRVVRRALPLRGKKEVLLDFVLPALTPWEARFGGGLRAGESIFT